MSSLPSSLTLPSSPSLCPWTMPRSFPPQGLCTCWALCQNALLPSFPRLTVSFHKVLYSNVTSSEKASWLLSPATACCWQQPDLREAPLGAACISASSAERTQSTAIRLRRRGRQASYLVLPLWWPFRVFTEHCCVVSPLCSQQLWNRERLFWTHVPVQRQKARALEWPITDTTKELFQSYVAPSDFQPRVCPHHSTATLIVNDDHTKKTIPVEKAEGKGSISVSNRK